MKKFIILNLFLVSFIYADIKVIASPICKVETLLKSDVKNLFMVKKRYIDDESIIILDTLNKETYNFFIKKYLKKSSRKMKVYWTRMLFTGKKIPPKKFSIKELTLLDTSSSCYLSYVKEENKPKNWSIIKIK